MLTAWLLFPLLLALFAVGFGLLVEGLSGRRMPWPILLMVGAAAYTAWSGLLVVPALVDVVYGGTFALTALGFASAVLRRRPFGRDWWPALALLVPLGLAAAPFLLAGRPTFGGYSSLGDGAFQMVGADLLPRIGATKDLAQSTIRSVMEYRFANGYPAGAVTAIGIPDRLLGAPALHTFTVAVCAWAALTGLGIATLARSSGLASARGAAVIGAVAGCAPLFQGFVLQSSIKEIATAALVVALVATTAWAWPHLRAGATRPGLAIGLLVASVGAVLGPGAAVYVGPFALLAVGAVVLAVRRGAMPRSVFAAAGLAVVAAAATGLPSWLAALRFTRDSGAVDVLSTATEFGNLAETLPVWKAAQGWLDYDYRFFGDDLAAQLFTAVSAVLVIGLAVLGAHRAVRRRSWGWLGWLVAIAVPTTYLVVVGSPWAAGKALAILSATVFALAATGLLAAWAWRRSAGAAAVVLLGLVLAITGYHQYRGAPLGPGSRLDELASFADEVGTTPVLLSEYDEYSKVLFSRGRPMSLGEENFLGWRIRYDGNRPTPIRITPNVDRLTHRDLAPFGWIVVRRSPISGWPSSSFRLARTTRHYWLFRRVSDALPRRWAGVERDGLATESLRCGQLRGFERGTALLRPWARSWIIGAHSDSWVPQVAAPYLIDTPSAGAATVEVEVPRDGRYLPWLEGSFNRPVSVLVDGRPVGSIPADARNQQAQPEPAGPEGGIPLRRGRHVVTFNMPRNVLRPGASSISGQIGRFWLEDAASTPRQVPVSSLRCTDGVTPRVDWLQLR